MEMVELGSVASNGLFKDGDWIESKDQDANGKVRLLQLADIGVGNFIDKSSKFVNDETFIKLKCTEINNGDILIARMPDPIGRACIFESNDETYKYITAVDVAILRVNEDVCNKYVVFILNTPQILSESLRQSTGATRKRISRKKLSNIQIPLPPLAEQKRIAGILDEADQLRSLNKSLLEKYNALTQSLFLEMFGDPVLNPMGWEKVKLNEVTIKIGSGATPKGGKNAYKKDGISLIRSLNIHDNVFKYKDLAFIDDSQAKKLDNVIVKEGDVLFNITGASVTRCCIVPKDVLPARVNQHVAIVRTNNSLNSKFLMFSLLSQNNKNALLRLSVSGGATREAITKEQLKNYQIIHPPIALQNQFAERVAVIEQQKADAAAALAKSEDLFQALLQKAFKGEL